MSIAGHLNKAFVASDKLLLSFDELERGMQRRMFNALAIFIAGLTAIYACIFAWRGQAAMAGETSVACAFVLGCIVLARRRDDPTVPMCALSTVVFLWLATGTLRQGPALPAAGWWLSIIPFILVGAGFYRLAISAVLVFIGLVTYMQFGLTWLGAFPTTELAIEPWRHYAAVVGSELLALALILVAMRSRAQVAGALEIARAAASEAAALKARFLSNMSHEIRTPLTGIIGAAEIMDSAGLSELQRQRLIQMQRQSARTLLALVDDVLDFAKLDAGKMQLEQQPVFLRGAVFEANELFSMQAFAKGIELSSSCNPDVPQSFVGDATRLKQIVNNLVGNAVKFTHKGGVHIHLSLDPVEERRVAAMEGKRWVRIDVVDSGPGIPDARLQTLFHAFMQADASITRRFGGSGLGLSVAHELGKLMGGRIEVRSTVGEGSSFALVVPLALGSKETRTAAPSRRSDVVLATANRGLERHIKSLLHELSVFPLTVDRLPTGDELEGRSMVFIDAPLLRAEGVENWLAGHAAPGRRVIVMTPLGSDAVVDLPQNAELLFKPVRKKSLEALVHVGAGSLPAGAASAPAPRPFEHLHVLVAEDNPVNQVVIQAMLAELGASCAVASNGVEALDCAFAEPFDVILMDVHMPEMDGVSATRALRQREAERGLGRLVVLGTTATSEGESTAACLDAGMDGFLTKPFGLAQLRRALEGPAGRSVRLRSL